MAKRRDRKSPESPPRAEPRPAPRLYFLTPRLDPASDFAIALDAALGAADVACVLARLTTNEPAPLRTAQTALDPVVARHGVALLVEVAPAMAKTVDVDGVHVRGPGPDFAEALALFKPQSIVGVGGLRKRHDAMTVGEMEVDYLMFGEPAPDGWTPPIAETLEWVAWWSEIFNVPCVGYASSLDDVAALALAGADFVALGDALWGDPRGPEAAARAAGEALRAAMAGAA